MHYNDLKEKRMKNDRYKKIHINMDLSQSLQIYRSSSTCI